jgi:hypothetical protein
MSVQKYKIQGGEVTIKDNGEFTVTGNINTNLGPSSKGTTNLVVNTGGFMPLGANDEGKLVKLNVIGTFK